MGVKVKKEVPKKVIVSTDENIVSKLTMAVPCMGIIMMAAMGTYASSPMVSGNKKALITFIVLAGLGMVYTYAMYMWRAVVGQKDITVRAFLRGERTIPYNAIKRVEVKNLGGDLFYFDVIHISDRRFVRMYLVMTNCKAVLERLRKLGIKIVEK